MMRFGLIPLLALTACAAQSGAQPVNDLSLGPTPQVRPPADEPGVSYGRLNQDIRVGRLVVRPVRVTEDSRCPANVTCVWAGRLVLRVRVFGMRGEQEVSTMAPLRLPGGGVLELAHVWPPRYAGAQSRTPYRFGFRRR